MAGKVGAGLLSIVVLAATGYYWQVADDFSDGLTTTDVIAGPSERPADGAIDILMVGMDSRTDAQGNPLSDEQLRMLNAGEADGVQNTDTLIMIRIPNDGSQAFGVSIPRDSYVDIPGYGEHKINSAYARAKIQSRKDQQAEGVSDDRTLEKTGNREGAKSLIATVEKLTGASIDHYAEVNLLGFYDITNAVGGIDVCLKKAVRDRLSGANFPAGQQNLKGVAALAFVRQRHGLPNGDLDRIIRQQVFMTGMARKVFSQDMILPGSAKLTALQEAIKKSVVLDEGWDIIQFAQQMVGFTGGKLEFLTIPTGRIDLPTPYDGSAVEVDPGAVRTFVDNLLRGGPDAAPPKESVAAKPTVTVFNATDRTGLAGEVTTELQAAGYKTGEPDNSAVRETTVVRHATGEEAGAAGVVTALGGDYAAEPDANLPKGQVKVYLGGDYTGTDGLAAEPLLALNGAKQGPPCVN